VVIQRPYVRQVFAPQRDSAEGTMDDTALDDLRTVLQPLLQSLEALGFIARHLNPPDFYAVMKAAGAPDDALRAVRRDCWTCRMHLQACARGSRPQATQR